MSGFGEGPFGSGSFGEWPWSLFSLVQGVPSVYREQDDLAGAGALAALLEGLVPSLDSLRQKIRDYDGLRDPLKVPIDTDFTVEVVVIRADNQGDGTSIVYLSQGDNGDKFDGLRPGMTLTDLTGLQFNITEIAKSALPTDVTNPPIDPATGEPTGRHIAVSNIGQASTELVPFASSLLVANEAPSTVAAVGTITAIPGGLFVDGETFTLNDGVHPSVVFEFDKVPDGVTAGRIAINVSAATTAVDVANLMVAAINNVSNLNLVATNGGGSLALVTITNFGAGAAGNGSLWAETVANAGFVLVQPSGGAGGAFPLDPAGVDDGVTLPPYIFNLKGSFLGGLDIAPNRIVINWTEGGIAKSGFFTSTGSPGGDLADTATVNFSASGPTLAAGQIKLRNDSGAAIDVASIRVTYTNVEAVPVADAVINAQNILAFLSGDYGIKLDRNDPEFLQRSYVNNAFKIWDIKGTDLGYFVLGQYAGYFVSAQALYAISAPVASSLPSKFVYEFPAGLPAAGSILAVPKINIIDGETFTLDDGINPQKTFEFDTVPNGVFGSNIAVDISAAVTAVDVATAIVSAINSVGGALDLNASNDLGASSTVTIANGAAGAFGNVTSWTDTVADAGFVINEPTGGVDSDLFTTINPGRGLFDEIALDAIPLDSLCSDSTYPQVVQSVVATSSVVTSLEGSDKRTLVTVTSSSMDQSFDTDGVFTDFSGVAFDILNFERVNSTTYTFEVIAFVQPMTGNGTVTWQVLRFVAPNAISIAGIGTDVIDLGIQYTGYTGHRYRITKTFTDPILSGIGNWAFIDSSGVISYIENFQLVTGSTYQFEIISAQPPTVGTANIFYNCEIVTTCDFCRASSIFVKISPSAILSYPSALAGDALDRLVIRLQQMVPGHVRIAAFILDQGPAVALWGTIAASSEATSGPTTDVAFTVDFDMDEYPADIVSTDVSPIIATSEVTITDQNVFEEYIYGPDPIISGKWTATGLWHVTQYR